MATGKIIVVNLSGRGDKDVAEVMRLLQKARTSSSAGVRA